MTGHALWSVLYYGDDSSDRCYERVAINTTQCPPFDLRSSTLSRKCPSWIHQGSSRPGVAQTRVIVVSPFPEEITMATHPLHFPFSLRSVDPSHHLIYTSLIPSSSPLCQFQCIALFTSFITSQRPTQKVPPPANQHQPL